MIKVENILSMRFLSLAFWINWLN